MKKPSDTAEASSIPWWASSDIVFQGSRILTTRPLLLGNEIDLASPPQATAPPQVVAPRRATGRKGREKPWPPKDGANEHYTPNELAELWGYSVSTIYREIEDEPEVLKLTRRNARKRAYVTRQIPQEVALRVYRRLQKGQR